MPTSFRRIALVLHEDSLYTRNILRGIHSFSLQRNWLLRLIRPEVDFVQMLRDWRPDGIVTHVTTTAMVSALSHFDCPIVDTADVFPVPPFVQVGVDEESVGQFAAEHLIELGLEHFACVGFRNWHFSAVRLEAFAAVLAKEDLQSSRLDVPNPLVAQTRLQSWDEQESELLAWLDALPKPAGLFAVNDYLAFEVINACRRGNLKIPQELSIVGVDNDELLCELTDPPLSSVAIPTERLGHEAARLLEEMMAAGATTWEPFRLLPLTVIPRQSSDRRMVSDPVVSAALSYIHEHRGEYITVDDVLRTVSVSRRTLERAFRRELGHTPSREIRRVHLEQAKALLSQTEIKIEAVAWQSGFSDGKHLATVFKRETGMTPLEFRRRGQLPTAPS